MYVPPPPTTKSSPSNVSCFYTLTYAHLPHIRDKALMYNLNQLIHSCTMRSYFIWYQLIISTLIGEIQNGCCTLARDFTHITACILYKSLITMCRLLLKGLRLSEQNQSLDHPPLLWLYWPKRHQAGHYITANVLCVCLINIVLYKISTETHRTV